MNNWNAASWLFIVVVPNFGGFFLGGGARDVDAFMMRGLGLVGLTMG